MAAEHDAVAEHIQGKVSYRRQRIQEQPEVAATSTQQVVPSIMLFIYKGKSLQEPPKSLQLSLASTHTSGPTASQTTAPASTPS